MTKFCQQSVKYLVLAVQLQQLLLQHFNMLLLFLHPTNSVEAEMATTTCLTRSSWWISLSPINATSQQINVWREIVVRVNLIQPFASLATHTTSPSTKMKPSKRCIMVLNGLMSWGVNTNEYAAMQMRHTSSFMRRYCFSAMMRRTPACSTMTWCSRCWKLWCSMNVRQCRYTCKHWKSVNLYNGHQSINRRWTMHNKVMQSLLVALLQ